MASKSLIDQIKNKVGTLRQSKGIKPTKEKPMELSGMAHGEGFVFANSLLHSDNTALWNQLNDIEDDFAQEVLTALKTRF